MASNWDEWFIRNAFRFCKLFSWTINSICYLLPKNWIHKDARILFNLPVFNYRCYAGSYCLGDVTFQVFIIPRFYHLWLIFNRGVKTSIWMWGTAGCFILGIPMLGYIKTPIEQSHNPFHGILRKTGRSNKPCRVPIVTSSPWTPVWRLVTITPPKTKIQLGDFRGSMSIFWGVYTTPTTKVQNSLRLIEARHFCPANPPSFAIGDATDCEALWPWELKVQSRFLRTIRELLRQGHLFVTFWMKFF